MPVYPCSILQQRLGTSGSNSQEFVITFSLSLFFFFKLPRVKLRTGINKSMTGNVLWSLGRASQYSVRVTNFLTLSSNTMYQRRVLIKCYIVCGSWPVLGFLVKRILLLHPLNLPIFSYTFAFLTWSSTGLVLVPLFVLKWLTCPLGTVDFFQDPIHDSVVFCLLKNADMCYVFFLLYICVGTQLWN